MIDKQRKKQLNVVEKQGEQLKKMLAEKAEKKKENQVKL